jgi:hypothetical protein
MNLDTKNIKRKNPINRNNFFVSEQQQDFQLAMSMEYINKVLNQTIVLYEVDLERTKIDEIYVESNYKNIVFKTPVELNVMYTIDKAELKTYDTKTIKGYYAKTGKLNFQIMAKELEANDCDIKRGDYIGVQVTPEHMEFFIVTDDGRVNFDNRHTLWGTKPYFRSISCTVVTDLTETQNM